ncbi:MAG TPA: ABC transporter permease [Nocardioides sp.]|nr:ABC transporter permease [Nocardioides sp.]
MTEEAIAPAVPSTTEDDAARLTTGEPDRARRRVIDYLESFALPGCLVLAGLYFALSPSTSGTFLTAANLQVLIGGQAVVATVALALLVPLCADQWDLSVGATAGLGAVYAAVSMSGGSLVKGLVVALAVGALVGLVNALIVTRFNVNAVIATLGTMTIIAGVINLKTGGVAVVSNIPQSLINLGSQTVLGVPKIGVLVAVVALAVHYLLEHTPYGRYLYALGANPTAARLVGLRTKTLTASAFVVAGVLASIAGILAVARTGGANPRLGDQLLLPAFAAAFLSAASIKPGRPNVGGLLVAVYFLAVLNNGLSLAGAQPYVSSFVNGGALIVGVALATYLGRRRRGA